jgi:hypothetical protein
MTSYSPFLPNNPAQQTDVDIPRQKPFQDFSFLSQTPLPALIKNECQDVASKET